MARLSPRAAVAACLGPLVVAAWGVGELDGPSERGRVGAMHRRLAADPPAVLVLGDSLARADVDVPTLAEGLSVPERAVTSLTLPDATVAHAWAILRHRVEERGHRPGRVLLVGALATAVMPAPSTPGSRARLWEQAAPGDALLADALGVGPGLGLRLGLARGRAEGLRAALVAGWRDAAVGLIFRAHDPARLVERANAVVFGDEAADVTLARALPTGLGVVSSPAPVASPVDLRLLVDLRDTAARWGAELTLVRVPLAPDNPGDDDAPPEVVDAVRAALGPAGLLDLSTLPLGAARFRDARHLDARGAALFTRALVDGLLGREALGAAAPATEGLARGAVRLVGGRADELGVRRRVPADTPPIALGVAPQATTRGGVFVVPGLAALADADTPDRPHGWQRCSPVRVMGPDRPLDAGYPCAELDVPGRSCHAGDVVRFSGEGTALALAVDRGCPRLLEGQTTPARDALWVYPGDAVRLVADGLSPALGALRVRYVGVSARTDQPLSLFVARGDALVVDQVLPVPVSGVGEVVVPASAQPGDQVGLRSAGGYWLVTSLVWEPAAEATPAPTVALRRTGEAPAVEQPRQVRALPGGLDEHTLFPLWPVSATVLVERGHGPVSPLRAVRDGVRLTPTASRRELRTCEACFLHSGKVAVVRPGSAPPSWSLTEEVGPAAAWVYPGTSLTLDVAGLPPGATLRLRADPLRAAAGDAQVTLLADGVPVVLTQGAARLLAEVPARGASMGLTWTSPAAGPFVLVDLLEVRWEGGAVTLLGTGRQRDDLALPPP